MLCGLTFYSCCLSPYQTQLFSLLQKQIESLITCHHPAPTTIPDQYPLAYLSFTTEEYTSHTQDKPSWVDLHAQTEDSPFALPATDSQLTNHQGCGVEMKMQGFSPFVIQVLVS